MLGEASANIRRRSAKVLRNFPEHETPSGKHPRRYGDASASSCEPSPRHPRGIGEWLLGGHFGAQHHSLSGLWRVLLLRLYAKIDLFYEHSIYRIYQYITVAEPSANFGNASAYLRRRFGDDSANLRGCFGDNNCSAKVRGSIWDYSLRLGEPSGMIPWLLFPTKLRECIGKNVNAIIDIFWPPPDASRWPPTSPKVPRTLGEPLPDASRCSSISIGNTSPRQKMFSGT